MTVSFQDPEISVESKTPITTFPPLEEIIVRDNTTSTKAPPDTLTSINNTGLITRTETRKSKMRLKTYFQRCKEAFIGTPTEENCPITHQSSTSWYLEENTHSVANNKTNTNKSENTEETLITANNNQQPDVTENGKNNINNNNIKSKQIEIGHEKNDFCATLNINSNKSISQNGNMNEQLLLVNVTNNNGEIVELTADGNHQNKVQSVCLKNSTAVEVS